MMRSVGESIAREVDDGVLSILLHDPEWLRAEFEAIMQSSGIRDGSTVALAPRMPHPPAGSMLGSATTVDAARRMRFTVTPESGRVRSPPAR